MKFGLLLPLGIVCSLAAAHAEIGSPLIIIGSIGLPGVEGRIDHFGIEVEHHIA